MNSAARVERVMRDIVMAVTDHKTVGLEYAVTSSIFLAVGFALMLLMRWQLAWPGQPLPAWIVPRVRAGVPADVRTQRVDRGSRSDWRPATSPFTTPTTWLRTS